MKKIYDILHKRPFVSCVGISFLLTFVVECLCRHSVFKACGFFMSNPAGFLFNVLIILTTLSVTLLMKKRLFGGIVVSLFWLILGVVSFVLKFFRVTPLSASDFRIFKSISDIFGVYLSKGQSVLILGVIVALVVLLPILWKKTPRWPVSMKKSAVFSCCVVAFLGVTATSAAAAFSNFTNLPDAYANYGFTYCFSLSVVDSGIKKPADYSPETMNQIAEKVETSTAQTVTAYTGSQTSSPQSENVKTPNILFLQLESFFDVNEMQDVTFSENPIPNFSALRESCPSGYITVPAYGCGTANSEFELISGMNLDYFGPNEYPYSTILKDHTCESLAYNLKEEGYGTHAIHNNRGTFYDRRHVYANLGFDTFTCLEYMDNLAYNQLGWAKDGVLTDEIMKALHSTEEPDYVYTVAVQTHGKYPAELAGMENYPIQVQGELTAERQSQLTYYAQQMQQTDAFLGELIARLSDYNEPVILVAYGDHLPSLGLTPEELESNSLYKTPYIVWSNYGFTMESQDLEAYQLGSAVLEQVGITQGYVNQLHQSRETNPDYQADLNALQYDMLYGEQQIFGGETPYKPTDLKLGIEDIVMTGLEKVDSGFYVRGENITEYSQVMVGDKVVDTQKMNDNTLWVPVSAAQPGAGDAICIAQVTSKGTVLSTSNSMTY